MYDFKDKVVVVTGGSRGIGKAIAMKFAEAGAKLAIIYRSNQATAKATLDLLSGSDHLALQADVADEEQVESTVAKIINHFGQFDVLVNNAGIGDYHPIEQIDFDQWKKVWQETISTNLIGPANLCFCAAKYMMDNGGGRIVNVSSRGAFRGEPDKPAYGASKAGINALSQSLAQKLAPYNIFVGAVAPGFVNTELTAAKLSGEEGEQIKRQSPLNRVANPEDVAQAVLFLAAPGSEFSTGTIIDVNGASYLRS
jgi:NAD(P)-dependent dehydrogenase (short-subunit alcohol dehydrogenase family)